MTSATYKPVRAATANSWIPLALVHGLSLFWIAAAVIQLAGS